MEARQDGKIGAFGIIALVVLGVLAMVAVVYGPTLVREGRAVGIPLMEMARTEKALDALDTTYPFTPPADGRISPDRLEAFLQIREDLKPRYAAWTDLVQQQTAEHGESWATAREVLAATSEIMAAQIRDLRAHRMAPAEFRWLEKTVYLDWLDNVDQATASSAKLRQVTEDDLSFVTDLEHTQGRSPALRAIRARLEQRLDSLGAAEDSASGPNSDLLEANRERISNLRLSRYSEIHGMLSANRRGRRGVTVGIHPDEDKGPVEKEPR